jgi:hypothetical protein
MPAQFRIDQATPGAGVAGHSRHDLVPGEEISLVATSPAPGPGVTYTWEILDKRNSIATLSATSGASVTLGPALEVTRPCSFLVELAADDNGAVTRARRIVSVRTANTRLRVPVFPETAPESQKLELNVPALSTDNAIYPNRSGLGTEQNWAGWSEWAWELVLAVEDNSGKAPLLLDDALLTLNGEAHGGRLLIMTSGAGATIDLQYDLPVGFWCDVMQGGPAATEFTSAAGITLFYAPGAEPQTKLPMGVTRITVVEDSGKFAVLYGNLVGEVPEPEIPELDLQQVLEAGATATTDEVVSIASIAEGGASIVFDAVHADGGIRLKAEGGDRIIVASSDVGIYAPYISVYSSGALSLSGTTTVQLAVDGNPVVTAASTGMQQHVGPRVVTVGFAATYVLTAADLITETVILCDTGDGSVTIEVPPGLGAQVELRTVTLYQLGPDPVLVVGTGGHAILVRDGLVAETIGFGACAVLRYGGTLAPPDGVSLLTGELAEEPPP